VSRISVLQNGDIVEFSNLKEGAEKIAHKLRITQINQVTNKDNAIEVI
jgi:hypothetical protein